MKLSGFETLLNKCIATNQKLIVIKYIYGITKCGLCKAKNTMEITVNVYEGKYIWDFKKFMEHLAEETIDNRIPWKEIKSNILKKRDNHNDKFLTYFPTVEYR